jgi:hypothetical protein
MGSGEANVSCGPASLVRRPMLAHVKRTKPGDIHVLAFPQIGTHDHQRENCGDSFSPGMPVGLWVYLLFRATSRCSGNEDHHVICCVGPTAATSRSFSRASIPKPWSSYCLRRSIFCPPTMPFTSGRACAASKACSQRCAFSRLCRLVEMVLDGKVLYPTPLTPTLAGLKMQPFASS